MNLVDEVASVASLEAAFLDVRRSVESGGGPSIAKVERLDANRDAWLTELALELANGGWRPGLLTEIPIPKADGSARILRVPSIEDRVVERAVVDALTVRVDGRQHPGSFAFRPGRGVRDALTEIAWLRGEGFQWVVRCDVADCFESLDHQRLLGVVHEWVGDHWFTALVERLINRVSRRGTKFRFPDGDGVAQGAPLSPLLCNLHLDAFDRSMTDQGVPIVRYADDFTLLCDDEPHAEEVRKLAVEAAAKIGLSLRDNKTRVTSFEKGFVFLGEDVGPVLPLSQPRLAIDPDRPMKRSLYVTVEGGYLNIRDGQVVVRADDEERLTAPIGLVERIVVTGSVGISAGLRNMALSNGMDVSFLSRRGEWIGRLDGLSVRAPAIRRAQLTRSGDDGERVALGREIVRAKLSNQRALLVRYARRDIGFDLGKIADRILAEVGELDACVTVDEVMGHEGAGSRAYFEALRSIFPAHAGFDGRNRRPPRDPANAALSFGYSVLLGEMVSALQRGGLDPAVGFLHADDGGRPSGALDLMEEFRPLIVDTTVIEMFRRGTLRPDLFRSDERSDAVLLNDDGRRRLLGALEERLLTSATHLGSGLKGSYRRVIVLQARHLASWVVRDVATYRGQPWR